MHTGVEDNSIIDYLKRFDLEKSIAIPENAGLIVSEEKIEEVGPGRVKFFE